MTTIGLVTFGCTATSCAVNDLKSMLPGVTINEVAILDRVAPSSLQDWRVTPDSEEATVVHLAGGAEETLQTAPLLQLARRATAELVCAGATVVLLGCAGPMPDWCITPLTVVPHHLLRGYLDGILRRGRVGLLVPSPVHVAPTIAGYGTAERSVSCRAASPSDPSAVAAGLKHLAGDGCDLIVLTCFDHTLADLRAARARSAVPVTSSRLIAASALFAVLKAPAG